MPKKTTILVIILAIVTVILLVLAVTESRNQNTQQTNAVPTQKPVERTAQIFFNPGNISATTGTTQSVDLILNSGNSDIAGVQVELQYDPKALTNVKILPDVTASSFFGSSVNVLFNEPKPDAGTLEFAMGIPPTGTSRKGSGKIATLTFQKLAGTVSTSTTISFKDHTLVTIMQSQQSVLKDTTPLVVNLGQSQVAPIRNTTSPQIPTQ